MWQRAFRVAHFLVFMPLCYPFPLHMDESCNVLLSKRQYDYAYLITLHKTAMPILGESLFLLALKKQATMSWGHMESHGSRNWDPQSRNLQGTGFCQKATWIWKGTFPSQVSDKITAPADTLIVALWDPEAENLA